MDQMEIEAQRELDREILAFVRGLQDVGPVTLECVARYLRVRRALRRTDMQIQDRLTYLAKSKLLDEITEWNGGSVTRYEITALGMDTLDGVVPPPGWKK